jgi:hypothetical protein
MACEDVRRAISDGDRRALRARTIRAHLRDCDGCSEFRSLIETREADLRVLAPPLPAAAAAAVLSGVLGSGAASHAGAAAGAPALAAAKGGASSLALKGVVGLALTAAIGAGAARLATAPSAHHRTPAHSHYSRTTAPASSSHARALAHQRTATQKAALRARPARPHAVGAPPAASGELLVGGVKGLRGVAAAGVPVRAHGAPAHARATHPSRAHHHAQPPKRRVPAKPTEHPHPKPPSAAERHVHEVTPPSPPVSTVQAPVE